MNLSELCIRRPVLTTLLTVSFIVVGVFAYRLLPISAMPRVDYPTISVTATLPGASPETMASTVAAPIEEQLSTIAGITSMKSTSSLGRTQHHHRIRPQPQHRCRLARRSDGTDDRAAQASCGNDHPAELPERSIRVKRPILRLVLSSSTLPLSTVHDYAETVLQKQISQIPGVAQVHDLGRAEICGARPDRPGSGRGARHFARRGAQCHRQGQFQRSRRCPAGPRQNLTLEANGQLERAADYRNLVVAWRNGAPVKLGEIARVVDSVENTRIASLYNERAYDRDRHLAAARRQHGRGRRRDSGHASQPARADSACN